MTLSIVFIGIPIAFETARHVPSRACSKSRAALTFSSSWGRSAVLVALAGVPSGFTRCQMIDLVGAYFMPTTIGSPAVPCQPKSAPNPN